MSELSMKNLTKIIYRAESRGFSDYGWLKTFCSFSFDDYYYAAKINFGKLCLLNDDVVEAGQGFGEHPHQDMEIRLVYHLGKSFF